MTSCGAVHPTGFISSMTTTIDCQAQALGSGAWQVLATPGSSLLTLLTGFLTILIALIGYSLLLGSTMSVRSMTVTFVKIGAVFALATSWPAYRTLIYDLVIDGPSQLVAEVGPGSGVAGSDGTLLERLDGVDQALSQLAILGPGYAPQREMQTPPPPFAGFDSFALGGARILFLLTAIAGIGAVRIVTGLMLALGPFFIAFLLFDSTRSLFEGWVRVLGGAALAAFGVSIALGLELAVIEPWLGDVLSRRLSGEALPTVPTELFVITCLFTIIVLAALFGCARVTGAFRLAPILRLIPLNRTAAQPAALQTSRAGRTISRGEDAERSRAAIVANVLAGERRRDNGGLSIGLIDGPKTAIASASVNAGAEGSRGLRPIGRSFTRRARTRSSERASRRDASA